MSSEIWIYTDGACSGNPGPGGWAFTLCEFNSGEVIEGMGHEARTTNNRMEMESVIRALEAVKPIAPSRARLRIFSDSKLLIEGATKWIHGWKKRGWTKADGQPVLNRELWEKLDAALAACPAKVEWTYVAGHSGIPGNERVDELAVAGSKFQTPALYRGSIEGYSLRKIFQEEPDGTDARDLGTRGAAKSGGPKGPAVYLSYVKGELQRHATWAECEKRVKGVAGAKFKKVQSPSEEAATLKGWGL